MTRPSVGFLRSCFILLTASLLGSDTLAATLQVQEDETYVLLSTSRTTTLQEEIDEAAKKGYRIVATASRGGGQVVLMKKAEGSQEQAFHRVLGTTRIDTMDKELNEAAAEGFCVLPGTMLTRTRSFGPPEIVVFLMRAPESSRRCEYRVLGSARTGTMEQEIAGAEKDGFRLVGLAQGSELAAVMERTPQ